MGNHPSTTLTSDLFPTGADGDDDRPGLVMVFSVNRPTCTPIPLKSEATVIGRKAEAGICLPLDSRMSRNHASVRLVGDQLEVVDLNSHNGTFVDGERVATMMLPVPTASLRLGDSNFICVPRIGAFLARGVEVHDDVVVGPTLAEAYEKLDQVAQSGAGILLTGASGVGKELAARRFHAAGDDAPGPLVAVNCANIQPVLAERLLFGAVKGAYSGADANAEGYLQAAHGGVLFLDEIAELETTVQAKLLRVLETREVMPLGATRPKPVHFRLCAATHKDLRAEVLAGRFRQDLYYRVSKPEVRIPSLRERREEIPWLAIGELRRLDGGLSPSASFIEACLLRLWPGNVREFLRELQEAVMSARADARTMLHATDLPTLDFDRSDHPSNHDSGGPRPSSLPPDGEIVEALRAERGNVSSTARRLRVHRNQLRRWLAATGQDVRAFRDTSKPPASPGIPRDS